MSEPSRWRRGERYETCVDDGVRGSAPKLCMAYSRARCLPSSEATAHPSLPTEDLKGASGVWFRREWEYKLLKDPQTKQHIESLGFKLINYRDLAEMKK